MKHIAVMKNWRRNTRSEKTKNIVEALSCYGKVEVEYLRGRSYFMTLFLGEGHLHSVGENEEWNQVRIAYKEKMALKIFDSRSGREGYLFDENFTRDENKQIEDALVNVGILTWQTYVWKSRWRRSFHFFGAIWGFLFIVYGYMRGDSVFPILGLGLTLCFLWFLLRK